MEPLANTSASWRTYGPLNPPKNFPKALKNANSIWKPPRLINNWSYLGDSWLWIYIATFAMAKSYVTTILVLPASTATISDLFMVSATTECWVGERLIWGKYHTWCMCPGVGVTKEFQPIQDGTTFLLVAYSINHITSFFQFLVFPVSWFSCYFRLLSVLEVDLMSEALVAYNMAQCSVL